MKQLNKRIKLAMMAVIVMMGMVFLLQTPRVYADSYTTAPQDVAFGETCSGTLKNLEKNRYNFVLKQAGIVTITGNMDQVDMKYGYTGVSARIDIYDEAGKRLSQDWVYDQYFEVTAYLDKGNYYFTIMGGASHGINYTLKPTYKEFPTTSVKKLTNKTGKKLKITWAKKVTVSGYQIQIATNSKFTKNKKTYTVNDAVTTSKTITKLKKSKIYYVRIRTYTPTLGGTKAYSKWSSVKRIRITK